jgi:hypothetical protein
MVTGFAAGGLVDLVPALAVMLGANVGTTLIVQVLSFDVAEIAPALILIGVLMFRRASAAPRDFGRVLIGLGLMLMALQSFINLLTPYEDVPSLRLLLGAIATQPMLDVVLAAGLTWAAHSSVAVVLLAALIHRIAGIRWRVSHKGLILFTDWVSRPSRSPDHTEPHPPCTTIRLSRSGFQPSDARKSLLRSMVGVSPRMAV